MAEERPEKAAVRAIWLDVLDKARSHPRAKEPLYLTLPGEHALDVQAMVDAGFIRLTETGAVHPDDSNIVVAVESRASAYAKIRAKVPGLRVLNTPIENVLKGESTLRFPIGDEHDIARATIVNLDYNMVLHAAIGVDGSLQVGLVQILAKLAALHAAPEPKRWWLLLTLNGEITWDIPTSSAVAVYLSENLISSEEFAECCQRFLGSDFVKMLQDGPPMDFKALSVADQQKLIMAFVPKRLARFSTQHGWRIETKQNLRYGGGDNHAPMTTWVLEFIPEPRASMSPDAVYLENISTIVRKTGYIDAGGVVTTELNHE